MIDGEAILINVVTGRYYSLPDAACVAWIRLTAGGSIPEVVATILERYDADPATVTAEVATLVDELVEQGLLAGAEAEEVSGSTGELPEIDDPRAQYTGIRLLTFTDMEDLLAFDPPLPLPSEGASPYSVWPG